MKLSNQFPPLSATTSQISQYDSKGARRKFHTSSLDHLARLLAWCLKMISTLLTFENHQGHWNVGDVYFNRSKRNGG